MTTNLPLSIILEEDHLRRIWAKGRIIPDFDPNEWRWDHAGRVMRFNDYGNRQSKFGWEKGHIIADALAKRGQVHPHNQMVDLPAIIRDRGDDQTAGQQLFIYTSASAAPVHMRRGINHPCRPSCCYP